MRGIARSAVILVGLTLVAMSCGTRVNDVTVASSLPEMAMSATTSPSVASTPTTSVNTSTSATAMTTPYGFPADDQGQRLVAASYQPLTYVCDTVVFSGGEPPLPIETPTVDIHPETHGRVEFARFEDRWITMWSGWCTTTASNLAYPPGTGSVALLWPAEYRELLIRRQAGAERDGDREASSAWIFDPERTTKLWFPGQATDWRLDPAVEPDASSTTLAIEIHERACASGETPEDREITVLATDLAGGLALTVFVTPVKGGALCPGNPFYPITVEIDGVLDDRPLFDGATFPPEERSWPPTFDLP